MLQIIRQIKICTKCKLEKDFSNFTKDIRTKDGLRHWCKECKKQEQANYKLKRPEIYGKRYAKEKIFKNGKSTKEKIRERHLLENYGITQEQWNALFAAQNGNCAICERNQSEFKTSLCTDHNHKNGRVRGLLCASCNKALGLLQDNSELCNNASKYLAKGE